MDADVLWCAGPYTATLNTKMETCKAPHPLVFYLYGLLALLSLLQMSIIVYRWVTMRRQEAEEKLFHSILSAVNRQNVRSPCPAPNSLGSSQSLVLCLYDRERSTINMLECGLEFRRAEWSDSRYRREGGSEESESTSPISVS